jgi:hypothetical protein
MSTKKTKPATKVEAPKKGNLNPQPAIEARRAALAKAGAKLAYQGRQWVIRSGKKEVTLTSLELSKTTPETILKLIA